MRDYVEQQFLLHADATGRRLREDLLRKVKLSNVEQRNFRLIQEVVFRMAKKLAALHSRRKKVFKRGALNVPRTLRHNMAYDGAIFDLHWKSVKIDRPKVFAICDVSGSVANYARFMLMFLYSLEEVMPKVRSFAFSSDLAEVTELFERNKIEDAIAKALRDYAGGSTDYGQAFVDFKKNCLDDVDNRTTIIILGDARNNYGDPRTDILKEMYDRCKRLIWLNPESRNSWTVGDAEMRRYSAYCHQVDECNSLMHLERIVGNLLRTVQYEDPCACGDVITDSGDSFTTWHGRPPARSSRRLGSACLAFIALAMLLGWLSKLTSGGSSLAEAVDPLTGTDHARDGERATAARQHARHRPGQRLRAGPCHGEPAALRGPGTWRPASPIAGRS